MQPTKTCHFHSQKLRICDDTYQLNKRVCDMVTFEERLQQIKTLDDIEVQMHRAKAYVMRLKRNAKAAETLQEKLELGQQVKDAERVLRNMRRSVFDIEDAIEQGCPAISLVKH